MLRTAAFASFLTVAVLSSAGAAHAQQGQYVYQGTDCGPASLSAVGVPRIGQTFTVHVPPDTSIVDGPQSYLLTGFAALPAPVDIGVLTGHQPCGPIAAFCGLLYSSVEVVQRVPFGSFGSPFPVQLPIPNDTTLVGLVFYQQNMTIGSGFGPRCVDLSRGGIGVIGV